MYELPFLDAGLALINGLGYSTNTLLNQNIWFMNADNKNTKGNLQRAIVFYLILLAVTAYFLIKLGVRIFEDM
ncbi:hypothetical protein L0P88_01575 [Muricauda sp. SCSIO 64092]|uniref:hypothetical protein n=1 Tax=Allomuricauda sp. SCSIO 64092 TaxID=2908842 RepID=UPI001FF6309F|nr:hypothetical protein [Muricauda sp. SCSIO 64092]UOY07255.1 hypothetical protein L0P88_01575 [Muricauda sp. SCSIO 64092]